MTDAPSANLPRCPACGDEVRCGMRLGQERCWCADLKPVAPDPELPDGACLCERCLRKRIAEADA